MFLIEFFCWYVLKIYVLSFAPKCRGLSNDPGAFFSTSDSQTNSLKVTTNSEFTLRDQTYNNDETFACFVESTRVEKEHLLLFPGKTRGKKGERTLYDRKGTKKRDHHRFTVLVVVCSTSGFKSMYSGLSMAVSPLRRASSPDPL